MREKRHRRFAPIAALVVAMGVLLPAQSAQAWESEFTLPAPAPAAPGAITSIARGAGALDVFWVHPDGAISNAAWTAASGRWITRPVAPEGSAVAGALSVVARANDLLDLFWIRPDGGVSNSWWHTGYTAWPKALSIASARHALPGTLTAAGRNPDQLDVFWIEPDRSIGTTAWSLGGAWREPWRLTGAGVAQNPGALTVVSRARDNLDVFWVRPDAGVSVLTLNPATPWNSRAITGAGHVRIGSSRDAVRPALTAVSHREDQVDVFWIGPDGAVGTTVRNTRLDWPAPWPITSPGAAQPGALDSVSRSAGRFDLVWVAPDGAIRNLTFDEKLPGSWAAAPVTGAGRAQANAVSLTTRHPDLLDAFWIRPDGSIGTNWWHLERIRVHVKVVNLPGADYAVIDTKIKNMVTAFAQAEIGVDLVSVEHITVTDTAKKDVVDVGFCEAPHPPTSDMVKLFDHRNNVQANEIALYVVPQISPSSFAGCSRHPDGKPGAVFIYAAEPWAAAHETGHVLGLQHPDCTTLTELECARYYGDRLMLPKRVYLTKPVPEILSGEKVTMYQSPLSR
ncbi:hypothetical protein [Amycolatopsis sp. NPDC059657]|uniref:hypothetical protein n=1 Tax=Amycolatopsis sp. NPDC059657 TaxID=3346899 RepID=UPI00366B5744